MGSICQILNNIEYDFLSRYKDSTLNGNNYENPYYEIDLSCSYFNNKQFIEKCKQFQTLKFLSWNIQSLNSKFIQLKEYIDYLKENKVTIDVISLQEVWTIYDQDIFKIDDYIFIYKCRKNKGGGGIAYYIHKNLKFKILNELSTFEEGLFESLTIQLEYNKEKFVLSNVYRPNTSIMGFTESQQMDFFIDNFSNLQSKLMSFKCASYIFTDSNFDILKYHCHEKTNDFLENCIANGFLSLITRPTRISRTSATCIDQIFTNAKDNSFHSGILLNDISDHFPIFTITPYSYKASKESCFFTRNINEEKITGFINLLRNVNWENVTNSMEPQHCFNKFYELFNEFYELSFPLQRIRINKNIHKIEKFMTDGLMRCRDKKFELSTLSINEPTADNIRMYNRYRNVYNRAIKTAKKLYYCNELKKCKSDLRKTWDIIRDAIRKTKDKATCINELKFNDAIYLDNAEISEKLNEHFTSVASKISSKINPSNIDPCSYIPNCNSSFKMHTINPNIVVDIVKKMGNKQSMDIFGLSNSFLKKIISVIALPLSHVINQTILTGKIPSELKIAKVIPIFKLKGNNSNEKADPSNYRPISLLAIFSKVLEKVIYQQLSCYLIRNNIIFEHQYGFQSKKSTIHPVIHLLNYIAEAKNDNKTVIGVFCDLAKCFDTIPHSILIKKLSKIGINGVELEWFKNYLSNRQQFVHVNNTDSTKLKIDRGVPQGSILGPILFLIYINDLKNCTDLFTLLFADDSNFLISGKNFTEIKLKLNNELKKISDWFRSNQMSLNPDKTKIMIFNKNENTIDWNALNIKLNFNNENEFDPEKIKILNYVNSSSNIPAIKFLGVFIDPSLNFKYHVEHLRKKISSSLFLINRAKHILNLDSKKMLFHSLINSHLLYCLPAWSCGLKSTMDPLIKLQKKAIRIVFSKKHISHTMPLFKKMNVLPLHESANYLKLLFMYDFINSKLPSSFQGTWLRRNQLHTRNLRNSNMFDVKKPKFKSIERFPKYHFQELWNNHCNNDLLTHNQSRKKFMKNLKESLLSSLTLVCNNPLCQECR